jgi:hypothetical protein
VVVMTGGYIIFLIKIKIKNVTWWFKKIKIEWKFMYKATVSQSCSTVVKQIVRISLLLELCL